jgi:aryl-alcohol dehydrogenase-like predicted oxidoreductase
VYSTWVPGHQGGESEAIIGQWFKAHGKREQVILATKVGMKMGDGSKGLKKDYILRCAEESLARMNTDYIDLYQSHDDDNETLLEETLSAYDMLLKQGKVRAIGASNYGASRLRETLRISQEKNLPFYCSLQPEYNLFTRQGYESTLEPLCLEKNIAVITYFSLASGFLTGKYRSQADLAKSPRGQGIGKKYLNARGLAILQALDEVAAAHNCTLAPIALAWLLQRESVTAPIVSATNTEQLAEIFQAVEIQLSPDEVQNLDDASAY